MNGYLVKNSLKQNIKKFISKSSCFQFFRFRINPIKTKYILEQTDQQIDQMQTNGT
jgi:hypothetical protein